jgi:hypothetical protein
MRAMVFDRHGELDVLHLKDVPVPEPQDGEVLIRVGYSRQSSRLENSLGPTRAHYRYVNFPLVTGMDAAGVVERTGANVSDFSQGDPKKSEKSKMSNRPIFEFAFKVRKSTTRELRASRRELLVQLVHKTYELAREKAERTR